jgi:hypothetical protein
MKNEYYVKVTANHSTIGDTTYIIYDLTNKKIVTNFLVKNSTHSQCNYFGVCNAISFFNDATIYTSDKNVLSWIEKKKYNSKKYTHKHVSKCDSFLQNLTFKPNVKYTEKIYIPKPKKETEPRKKATENFDDSIIKIKHETSNLVCYTDGTGDNMDTSLPISFSFVIYEQEKILHTSINTCNDPENTTIKAEIMGINLCLSFLISENLQNEKITMFSDAKWVVDWVCNNLSWSSKSPNAPYYKAFLEFREYRNEFTDIEFIWIPRAYNTVADGLLR